MKAVIKKSPVSGRVSAPPSKSMAHRLIISAALAGGISTIGNVAGSEDILASMSCIKALGAEMSEISSGATGYKTFQIRGTDPSKAEETVLDANESGSTLRFLIPVAALSDREMISSSSVLTSSTAAPALAASRIFRWMNSMAPTSNPRVGCMATSSLG